MNLENRRTPDGMNYLVFSISDYELATAPLDASDRFVINSRIDRETPISDALMNAQLTAFRIEQAKADRRRREAEGR